MKTKMTFLLLLLALASASVTPGELLEKRFAPTTRMAAIMIR